MGRILSILDPTSSSPRALIVGGSEMAELVRGHKWGWTPLGPLDRWSSEHMAIANLTLSSNLPTVLFWGPELIMLYNDAYRVIAGARHPRALGLGYKDVWPEAWQTAQVLFREVYEHGETLRQENSLIPLEVDGKMEDHFWSFSLVPVHENGRVAGVFMNVQDTTEAYLAARKLRKSEARAQRVFQSIGDGVIVTDADARVTRINMAARWLTGWSAADATGRSQAEIFTGIREDTKEKIEAPAERFRRLGVSEVGTRHAILVARDGTERFIDYSSSLIRDEAGDVDGMVLVFRDITEKRRAEQEREQLQSDLRARYFELQAVYETSSIAMAMIDPVTFQYVRGNPKLAEMLQQPLDRLVGSSVFDLAGEVPGLRESLQQAANGTPVIGQVIEGELANRPGKQRYWQVEYIPVFSEEGKVKVIVASSIEITAERQMQKALLQSEKLAAVGHLAASIAHEINNPLEATTNLLYLARTNVADLKVAGLQRDGNLPVRAEEDIATVHGYLIAAEQELQRVALITSQTLRFHRQATHAAPTFCHEIVLEALAIYHGRMLNSQIEVETRKRSVMAVHCFAGEIRQVLNNLVGNGIDAMQASGGRLLIRSRDATEWKTGRRGVVLTVADTGPGMTPETQRRIFEPFFTTKDIGATGLGLWVSREIVERHQGSLRFKSSRRPGRTGTVFCLFLPLETAAR
jgi:PAS domain S-box-containing protein